MKVKLFAKFREKLGSEIKVEAKSVKEIRQKLEKMLGEEPIIAVNFEIADNNIIVNENDEIAAMPRFNGG